jgi:hypothetical protein
MAHGNTVLNQINALTHRVLGPVPKPTAAGIRQLQVATDLLLNHLPKVERLSIQEATQSYPVRKRNVYLNGYDHYCQFGETKHFGRVEMFVKWEKLDSVKAAHKPPRAIQFRDPSFAAVFATFIKPVERVMYCVRGSGGVRSLPRTPCIGKGMNSRERAAAIRSKLKLGWICFSIDCSRFDKHVSVEMLRLLHTVYLFMHDNRWRDFLVRLLEYQIVNRGRSRHGVKYTCRGRRMSGDMDTALGNCITSLIMIMAFCIAFNLDWDALIDGDDALLFVREEHADLVRAELPGAYLSYGFVAKVESISTRMEDTEWCQSRPVFDGRDWRMIRTPWKILCTGLTSNKYNEPGARRRLIHTIGLCELALNRGIPILQEYAIMLLRNAPDAEVIEFTSADAYYWRMHRELKGAGIRNIRDASASKVTDAARLSFARAFNVSPKEQRDIELYLKNFKLEIGGDTNLGGVWTACGCAAYVQEHPEVHPVGNVNLTEEFHAHKEGCQAF